MSIRTWLTRIGIFPALFGCNGGNAVPPPATPSGGTDKMLLVGINKYPGCPLAGCVNDVLNMKSYLLSSGFKESDICILTDGQATTAAILDKLNWLTGIQPGGRCFFHYSGHGAQVPNPNEADGLSEVICPVDFDWSPARMITDKQFVEIFKKIPPGVKFNWCSDSCHSGDLDRVLFAKTIKNHPRRYPSPPALTAAAIEAIKAKAHKKTTIREMVGGMLNVGFASACQSDQTAADTEINLQPCGAFTTYFLKALRNAPEMPLFQVVNQTKTYLQVSGYDQIPCCVGARASVPFLR